MNTVQNGKGDRPRNNWGESWYSGYAAIDWHRDARTTEQHHGLPDGREEGRDHSALGSGRNGKQVQDLS